MAVELDTNDPFDQVLIQIVRMNRKKRADYALDGDPFSNFRLTAAKMQGKFPDFTALDSVDFNRHQKAVRMDALHANGREPANESVRDTLLDDAVYAVIKLAIYDQDHPAQS